MGVTTLPSSLLLPREAAAAAARAACATRRRLHPADIKTSAAASRGSDASLRRFDPAWSGSSTAAATKGPKRPGSCSDDEQPMKRRRTGAEDAGAASRGKAAMSSAEKDCVKRLRLSLPPLVRSQHKVIRLPDSIISILQENGDKIEICRNTLGGAIKGRAGACLGDRLMREVEVAPEQSKDRVIKQSKTRSILSKAAASKRNPLRAASKIIPPTSIPPRAASKSIPLRSASKSIPPRAASKSIPQRPLPTSISSKPALKSIPARAELVKSVKTAISQSSLTTIPAKATTLKSIQLRAEHSMLTKTAIRQSPPRSAPPAAAPPLAMRKRMKELLADASKAMRDVVCRREIEKLRAEARRKVEQVVRTVEFNDPYIYYTDVFK